MMKTLILVTVFVILLGLGYCFVRRLDIRLTETRKRKGKLGARGRPRGEELP